MASQIPGAFTDAPFTNSTSVAAAVVQRGRAGLEMLLEARHFADDLDRDIWDFALEIETLRRRGLTHSDLRWLVCKGFLEQSSEIFPGSGQERCFHRGGALTFTETSCFVITDEGVELLRGIFPAAPAPLIGVDPVTLSPNGFRNSEGSPFHVVSPGRPPSTEPLQPCWDRDRQELRVGRCVVKRFKVPAPNQEVVLAVFDEEGWPVRIDDPLPPRPDLDAKRRLHDTINSLNRNQKTPLIRFLGDGTGQGVRWQLNEVAIPGGDGWQKR